MRVHVLLTLALGVLMVDAASAQSLECELFGCPDPVDPGTGPVDPGTGPVDPGTGPVDPGTGPVDPGTGPVDPGTGPVDPGTGGDTGDDACPDPRKQHSLPESASDRGKERSRHGLDKANEAKGKGHAFGHC